MKTKEESIISDESAQKRFWSKVAITDADGCWNWSAFKNNQGYGQFGLGSGNMKAAHRLSWIMRNGPINNGLWVLHECDNPSCVNPNHLFLGTVADNNHDRDRKGRFKRMCGPENGMFGGKYAARGERQHLAKLTKSAVITARDLHAKGWTFIAISKMFGVTNVAMSNAIKRRTWAHV